MSSLNVSIAINESEEINNNDPKYTKKKHGQKISNAPNLKIDVKCINKIAIIYT